MAEPNTLAGLVGNIKAEAIRRGVRERELARTRGPIARVLLCLLVLTAVTALGTLVYGLVQFPDAPVREFPEGFAGVRGYPYTRAQYETFLLGQRLLTVTAPLTFVLVFVTDAVDRWERRRR